MCKILNSKMSTHNNAEITSAIQSGDEIRLPPT